MDPLLLGALVAVATIFVLFSGVSVALGLLIIVGGVCAHCVYIALNLPYWRLGAPQ